MYKKIYLSEDVNNLWSISDISLNILFLCIFMILACYSHIFLQDSQNNLFCDAECGETIHFVRKKYHNIGLVQNFCG